MLRSGGEETQLNVREAWNETEICSDAKGFAIIAIWIFPVMNHEGVFDYISIMTLILISYGISCTFCDILSSSEVKIVIGNSKLS